MDLIKKAEKILEFGPICDHCLGRQFAYLGHGLDNSERGKIIRSKLEKKEKLEVEDFKKEKIPEIEEKKECWLCKGIFEKIDYFADFVVSGLKKYDFETFLIGCKLPLEVQHNEEKLWEEIGIEDTEPLKSEINRLIGKKVGKRLNKDVDFKRPDINVIIDIEKEHLNIVINSMFLFGRYNKLKRGLAQTKLYCPFCKGKGCEKCDYTGKKFKESIQEIIEGPLLKETKGIDTKFHGCGREDVDALCLGKRPFVIEIIEPEIRKIDLKKLEMEINKENKGKIEIFDLRFSNKEEAQKLKEIKPDKVYRVIIRLEKEPSQKELEDLEKLKGIIRQKTPFRVEKRRANLIRKRKVKEISWKKIEKNKLELKIKAEAGLYIKELVTGDEGRTKPNISEILNQKVKWESLDVLKVCW